MPPDNSISRHSTRFLIALAIMLVCPMILAARLWYLQVIEGDNFRQLSENNRYRTVYLQPPRGVIADRQGQVLAKNRASFNIEFIRADSPDPEATLERLAQILQTSSEPIKLQVQNHRRQHTYEPSIAVHDASREEVARVLAHRYELPGVGVQVVPARLYLEGKEAAHLLGYTREVSAEQLKKPEFQDYRHGDIVGQSGVESQLESELQGVRGSQRVIVDARGARVQELPAVPEKIGSTVQLTIDHNVQEAADRALEGLKGAIVVMDVRTGDILAMSSAPAFDSNLFTKEIDNSTWQELNDKKLFKLSNRGIQGTYPPGSVFKIFMAVAALAEKVTSREEKVNCPGFYKVGSKIFKCHKKTGHGAVNLAQALIQSCDVYFYTMGQRLGVDRIHQYATRFGLGEATEINLGDEKTGLIPSTEWKRKAFKKAEDQKWYAGETPSVVIGQGAVSVTPLQITRAMAALANGGTLLKPRILMTESTKVESDKDSQNTILPQEILSYIRSILTGVVYDPHGTGHKAQLSSNFDILVAGKTGTAQPASLDLQHLGEHLNDHAWFSAFAPADQPEVAVTALVENGGHGGAAAAPLVKTVLEEYFRSTGRETKLDFVGPQFLDPEEEGDER